MQGKVPMDPDRLWWPPWLSMASAELATPTDQINSQMVWGNTWRAITNKKRKKQVRTPALAPLLARGGRKRTPREIEMKSWPSIIAF